MYVRSYVRTTYVRGYLRMYHQHTIPRMDERRSRVISIPIIIIIIIITITIIIIIILVVIIIIIIIVIFFEHNYRAELNYYCIHLF